MGKIYYSNVRSLYILKLIDKINFLHAEQLDNFIRSILKKKLASDIIIDLDETKYLDSTILGVIARINAVAPKPEGEKYTIICNSASIREVLETNGLKNIFSIVSEKRKPEVDYKELSPFNIDSDRTKRIMIKAHENLIKQNSIHRDEYRDVVTYLNREASEGADKENGE